MLANLKISVRTIYTSVLIGIINLVIIIVVIAGNLDQETLDTFGYLGVFIANLLNSATLASPIPAFAVTFAAATKLDGLTLILLSTIATTIGESMAYFFGRGIEQDMVRFRYYDKMKSLFYYQPFLFLVIWIGIPNPIQSIGQAFAGAVKYPFWKYCLATFLGNIIWFTIVVTVGSNV